MDSIAYLHPFKSSAHHHDSEVRTCCKSEQRARPGLAQSFVFHLLCTWTVLSMTSAKRNKPEARYPPKLKMQITQGINTTQLLQNCRCRRHPAEEQAAVTQQSDAICSSANMSLRGEHSEFRSKTSTNRQGGYIGVSVYRCGAV